MMNKQICQDCGSSWDQITVMSKMGAWFDIAFGAGVFGLGLLICSAITDNYRWWGLLLMAWGAVLIINRKPCKTQRISHACPSCQSMRTVDVASPLGQEVSAHWKARQPPGQSTQA